jgi:Nse4 C-terminal
VNCLLSLSAAFGAVCARSAGRLQGAAAGVLSHGIRLLKPARAQDLDETEKQETDKNLDEMWGILLKEGRVPLLELVLNHASFAQTVENLFSCSFLVRSCFHPQHSNVHHFLRNL